MGGATKGGPSSAARATRPGGWRWALLALALPACAWISKSDLDARLDLDGDGVPRPEDCDDLDAEVGVLRWFVDADVDGFGDASAPKEAACGARIGLSAVAGDCDDADGAIYPGADERCNGEDDNCNGMIDDDPVDLVTWYVDSDGDGFGDPSSALQNCTPPTGMVDNAEDCDDDDEQRGPPRRWFADNDGDGFGGGPLGDAASCDPPEGWVASADDCDDADATIFPGSVERCDPADRDEDCDGLADDADTAVEGLLTWYRDADLDGFGDPRGVVLACDLYEGISENDDDCDDAEAAVGAGDCPPVDVVAGGTASCALLSDARVRCWGSGPVVDGAPTERRFSTVAVGQDHACGIDLLGTLSCWGHAADASPAVPVPTKALDVEGDRTCATSTSIGAALSCWVGGEEQLLRVSGEPFVAPLAGDGHGCGLLASGLRCVGGCSGPECARVDGYFTAAGAGEGFTCRVNQETGLQCWGEVDPSLNGILDVEGLSVYGRQLCLLAPGGIGRCLSADDGAELSLPPGPWLRLSAGAAHGCGLGVDGQVRCWGSDADGAASPPF